MDSDPPPLNRLERLFDTLLERDGAGGSWLAPLLRAAPRGAARLGELAEAPGWLTPTVAVRTETGRRGAFELPAAPAPALLAWYVEHPERLAPAAAPPSTAEAERLRHALLSDEPPGARARAQARARELMRQATPLHPVWWRLEEAHRSECVLITDRLVVLVRDGDAGQPPTPWFPARGPRVRDLEAARRVADGDKAWGVLTLVDAPSDPRADRDALAAAVRAGAPHLDPGQRDELLGGDLGELGFDRAAAVTGA